MTMKTFDLNDVMHIEGDSDEDDYYSSIQRAINDGMWSLQGSYGRAMMDAIKAGCCMLGVNPARDAYGNRIPSRTEVQEGTKGSRSFVVERMGEEWANLMEAV
jgi:hypothetical protein